MLNNLLQYGVNVKIDFESDVETKSFDKNFMYITINNQHDYFQLNNIYLNQIVTIVDKYYNLYSGRIDNIYGNTIIIKVDNITNLNNIEVKYIYLNKPSVYSGTYKKLVLIKNIHIYGQQIINNDIKFNVSIDLDKPKFVNVYKYFIKYKFVGHEFHILELISTNKNYKNEDILNVVVPYNNESNELLIKVCAHYLNNKLYDSSFYSDIKIIKNDL